MTKAEKRHLDRVASLGCIVCGSPAEVHHIRTSFGMSQRASNYLTVPLCPFHHRQGGFGEAIHAGQKQFEMQYGAELSLLAETIARLSK